MEGVVAVGKLRRIQAVIKQFVRDKIAKPEIEFDWDKSIEFIKNGKGQLLPVNVNSNFKIEKTNNAYYEKKIIENQLKTHFLIPYNLSKPK